MTHKSRLQEQNVADGWRKGVEKVHQRRTCMAHISCTRRCYRTTSSRMVPVRASVILDVTFVAPVCSVLSHCDKFIRNHQATLSLPSDPPSVGLTILVTTKSGAKKQFYRFIYFIFCYVFIPQWGDTSFCTMHTSCTVNCFVISLGPRKQWKQVLWVKCDRLHCTPPIHQHRYETKNSNKETEW